MIARREPYVVCIPFLVLLLLSTGGCNAVQNLLSTPSPTPTLTPTSTVTPTSTPVPTSTPTSPPTATPKPTITPTRTSVPTSTPTPTVVPPALASDYLVNPVIDLFDPFDNSYTLSWDLYTGTIANAELTIVGDGNWSGPWLNPQFTEGQGIIMRYKTEGGREWSIDFDNGASWGSAYRSLGVADFGYPGLSVFKGTNLTAADDLQGNLQPKLGAWYQIMMVIGDDAHFLVVISDTADPTQVILHKETFGEEWADLAWNFSIAVNQGTLTIDDFMKVSFSDIK